MEPNGNVALVTGGAIRVGRAIALAPAGAGADVVIHSNSSDGEARRTEADIVAPGRRSLAVNLTYALAMEMAPAVRVNNGRAQ